MLLVIETATEACSAALLDGDVVLAEAHEIVGRGHAERLVPIVAGLLDGRRPDAILVDCGPGSFTGVRVGLAAGQGLAIGWRVPLTGYSSLALLAAMAGGPVVAAAMQGGHGELFVQSFAGGPIAPTDALRSLAPAEAAATIAADRVVGSGAKALVAARGHGEAVDLLPRADKALRLPPPLRSLPPRPIYGRAPDAKAMSVPAITLHDGGFADLDAIVEVMEDSFDSRFGEAWTASQCAGLLPLPGVWLTLARNETGVVGFALARLVASEAELLLLAVRRGAQRRGVGRRLLDGFIADSRRRGVERLHLEVREGNHAVKLYERSGFSLVGRRRNYYCGADGRCFDALTLARIIDAND